MLTFLQLYYYNLGSLLPLVMHCVITIWIIHFTEMGRHLVMHGDGVKDVAFEVEDLDAIVKVSDPELW